MHLLVLSAFRPDRKLLAHAHRRVSMHLLVLSAFRQVVMHAVYGVLTSLNAPFGAQCFPTARLSRGTRRGEVSMHLLVLSAFRLASSMSGVVSSPVSMHLLVLSAFRQ